MIHLRRRILPLLVPLPAAHIPPLFSLHRLLSPAAAASPVPPKPFAVDDYLVATCGLTRAQAVKASKRISHLKSPSNPDAVLAFLSGLGLSSADVTTLVAKDPQFLCASAEQTLAPRVAELSDLGLSRPQIASLFLLAGPYIRKIGCRSLASRLAFWRSVFDSYDKVVEVVNRNNCLLGSDFKKVIMPNVAFLQQCGVNFSGFSPGSYVPRMFSRPCNHVRDALARVDEFGVQRDSSMFSFALMIFVVYRDKIDNSIRVLKELGWSHDDLLMAVRRAPTVLSVSEERIRQCMKFLMSDVGLDIPDIVRNPTLLLYNLECRLLPRHRLISVLKAKGLLKGRKLGFFSIASLAERKFIDRFVHPYKESVPGLADAYASSCAGHGMHLWEFLCENTES